MKKLDYKEKKTEKNNKSWVQFPQLCKSCGLCIERCPQKCLSIDKDILGHFSQPTVKCDIEKCIQCKICENTCPDSAIRVKD